mmetsp:Transcript_10415/g.26980  ORF Transcript_10415/g.26980 Transcript_10415/m.26980 type:complete len:219 (+) Transcript_10415:394-1050(+)
MARSWRRRVHRPALVLLYHHAHFHPWCWLLLLLIGRGWSPVPQRHGRDVPFHDDVLEMCVGEPRCVGGEPAALRGHGGVRRAWRGRQEWLRQCEAQLGHCWPAVHALRHHPAQGMFTLRVLPGVRGRLRPPLPMDGEVHRQEKLMRVLQLHCDRHELPWVHIHLHVVERPELVDADIEPVKSAATNRPALISGGHSLRCSLFRLQCVGIGLAIPQVHD